MQSYFEEVIRASKTADTTRVVQTQNKIHRRWHCCSMKNDAASATSKVQLDRRSGLYVRAYKSGRILKLFLDQD
jgi:hypothetical protein